MLQQIINDIIPIVVTAIGGILVKIIQSVGDAIIKFIDEKTEAEIQQKGIAQYNAELEIGRKVYGIVDEYFRVSGISKTIEAAQTKFKEEILKKIPGLTDEEIEFIRQAIAGEINKGRDVINSNSTTTTTVIPTTTSTIAPPITTSTTVSGTSVDTTTVKSN